MGEKITGVCANYNKYKKEHVLDITTSKKIAFVANAKPPGEASAIAHPLTAAPPRETWAKIQERQEANSIRKEILFLRKRDLFFKTKIAEL